MEVGGRLYRLYLPTVTAPTVPGGPSPGLRFRVTPDEEHVDVSVVGGGRTTQLRPRSHHYLLLELARQRQRDGSLAPADRGWVTREDLGRRLRLGAITVNVQLHRVRQDLGQHGEEAAALVEVRAGSGHVRLGTDDLAVEHRP